ncbi:MAG: type IV pilin protein [Alteromonas sp.]
MLKCYQRIMGFEALRISRRFRKGFSLIESMIVVAIIAILVVFASTSYHQFTVRAELSETAALLGQFAREFETWRQIHRRYPNDSHAVLPPYALGLAINENRWLAQTGLGGNWNWAVPNGHSYAGVAIFGALAPIEDIEQFYAIIDDLLIN